MNSKEWIIIFFLFVLSNLHMEMIIMRQKMIQRRIEELYARYEWIIKNYNILELNR